MTNGDGQGVGGIRTRFPGKPQQHLDHVLHLLLCRLTVAGNRSFYGTRAVIVDKESVLHNGDDSCSTGMTEFNGRTRIRCQKNLLNRRNGRSMNLHHLIQTLENFIEAVRKGLILCGFNNTADNKEKTSLMAVDDAVSGNPASRINPEDPCHVGNRSGKLLHQGIIDVEIGIDILHIFMLFKIFHKF